MLDGERPSDTDRQDCYVLVLQFLEKCSTESRLRTVTRRLSDQIAIVALTKFQTADKRSDRRRETRVMWHSHTESDRWRRPGCHKGTRRETRSNVLDCRRDILCCDVDQIWDLRLDFIQSEEMHDKSWDLEMPRKTKDCANSEIKCTLVTRFRTMETATSINHEIQDGGNISLLGSALNRSQWQWYCPNRTLQALHKIASEMTQP